MPSEFDLKDLVSRLQYVGPPFPIAVPDPKNLNPLKSLNALFNKMSKSGVELKMPVAIWIPGQERYQLPNEPIMNIRGSFDITRTSLNRGGKRRGTVKEIYDLNDYSITLTGLMYNEDEKNYPEEDFQKLTEILEYPGAKNIDSLITRLLNITMVTIEDFDFNRDPSTSYRSQPYSIKMISDEDFVLEL